jgi:molybdopterin-binding protein
MLDIDHIRVSFPGFSLEEVSLHVASGDYLALLGVSGAGKTVLLEVLAGLIRPSSGRILLNGRDITRDKVQGRGIGLVYQDLSLFPHMTVRQNIGYPLKEILPNRQDRDLRVRELAAETGIPHLLDRHPGTLSGGEAQRVALARTLASDPKVLLLDEPLANLDVKLKAGLRSLLRRIHRGGKTVIHVTHDFMEAATLANRVAVIEKGRLVQCGTPEEVFRHPATEFVARFGGVKNLFACRVEGVPSQVGMCKARVGDGMVLFFVGQAGAGRGFVMVPQEDIFLSEGRLDSSAVNQLHGTITEVLHSGQGVEVVAESGEGVSFVASVSRKSLDRMDLHPGKPVWLSFKASAVRFIPD